MVLFAYRSNIFYVVNIANIQYIKRYAELANYSNSENNIIFYIYIYNNKMIII